MWKRRIGAALLLTAALAGAAAFGGDSRKASLLKAWEASQRADPETDLFEPLGEGRYRFRTERFPFDGELLVHNLFIDESAAAFEEGVVRGVVEVELLGSDDGFLQKFARSYGAWAAGNTLYLDADSGRWLAAAEWSRNQAGDLAGSSGLLRFVNLFWILFFILLVVFFFFLSRSAKRQMKAAMAAQEKALAEQERAIHMTERSLALAEEGNRLLAEILAALRGEKSGKP